jgi:hypothetical protein
LCAESGDPEKVDAGMCNTAKQLYELYRAKNEKETDLA